MTSHQQAANFLIKKEPGFKAVIQRFGIYELTADTELSLFHAVSRTIIYQQLAGKAAASIYQKFIESFADNIVVPEVVLNKSSEELRAVGLSKAKLNAIKHLAENICSGLLPDNDELVSMSDQAILDSLVKVKGVGPWTANIALMFWLGRPDIFPANDLGLRKGIQKLYQLSDLPNEVDVIKTAKNWQPYRTYASWYLWRLLEI